MEPFDTRSRKLVAKKKPKRILDFGCGFPPHFALGILHEFPDIEAWCVDVNTIEETEGIHFLTAQTFIDESLFNGLQDVDYAHASLVFHEICNNPAHGEEIGGIYTPEGTKALAAIFSCLRPGGILDLIDVVACDFYNYVRKTRPSILESAGYKKLADAVYRLCICKNPSPDDIHLVAEITRKELGRDESETALVLQRLFLEYPPLRGPERKAEEDKFIRLLMHLRKYKDHHMRCSTKVYEDSLQESGFSIFEKWTPDGMRFQFVCRK